MMIPEEGVAEDDLGVAGLGAGDAQHAASAAGAIQRRRDYNMYGTVCCGPDYRRSK